MYTYEYVYTDICVHIHTVAMCDDLRADLSESAKSTGCLVLQYARQNQSVYV